MLGFDRLITYTVGLNLDTDYNVLIMPLSLLISFNNLFVNTHRYFKD